MAEHWSWPVDVANLLVDSSSLFVCGDQSGRMVRADQAARVTDRPVVDTGVSSGSQSA